MASASLEDLLSVDTLTGLVRTFADQRDNRSSTNLFSRYARPLLPEGDSVSWDEVVFSRALAPVAGVESPHTQAKRLGVRKRTGSMAMIKVYKDLPSSHLFLQRAPGSSLQDAEGILAAELEDLGNLIANTKEYLATGALMGVIDVNPQRVAGSDVTFRVEFGVGSSATQSSWANPATRIRSDEVGLLKDLYRNQSGLRAEIVITEPTVERYITTNPDVREMAKDGLALTITQSLGAEGVNPQWALMGGLNFRFTDGTYVPEGGQVTSYFEKDHVVVLPGANRLPQVFGWAEGRVFVPAGPVFGSTAGAVGLVRELRGSYAYAELRTDPVGVRVYAGWYGLPVILNPSAVLKFKVVP